MRTRLRTALLLAIAGVLTAGTVAPASASEASASTWSPDLSRGEAAGVTMRAGAAELDPQQAHLAPQDATTGAGAMAEGGPDAAPAAMVPTGLLTLDPQTLDRPTDRVESALVADLPPGSTATVDVRGRRATGNWTEWIPATPVTGTATEGAATGGAVSAGTVELPEPATEVQSRLVLTGSPGAEPRVRDVRLTAHPASASSMTEARKGGAEGAVLSYRVFATREGLVGGTTANGHQIVERDHFVALPSRRALSPRNTSDYSVKVCAPNGRCAFAPVWDIGPWNTRDDYWNPGSVRQEWGNLPQGVPQAQAAYRDNFNGGKDQFGRRVANPAGIDLGDGVFWDALGLTDNSMVTVDYLWTGSVRLSKVSIESGAVDVLAAPRAGAEVVGIAADRADVPVRCALGSGPGSWLQIGDGQFVTAGAVPNAGPIEACTGAG
ncbi:hypothetical protein ACVGVM_03465 [Pseudonocardia bannensis]|uniref:Secreted protein n=1 Tax=Pseudonocardia bannensis TaxID=630973 RepID=A0A848DR74_9PSEU|nr:hypothetical protein [Pseudonocardia bannensis]NMH95035.1 hypothetical protein [Pseudonocardia bannensis]